MKLRVALCAAVVFFGVAAFAQDIPPWTHGYYDKVRVEDVRVPVPFKVLSIEDKEPVPKSVVTVFIPPGKNSINRPKLVLLPTNPPGSTYRANYFRFNPSAGVVGQGGNH